MCRAKPRTHLVFSNRLIAHSNLFILSVCLSDSPVVVCVCMCMYVVLSPSARVFCDVHYVVWLHHLECITTRDDSINFVLWAWGLYHIRSASSRRSASNNGSVAGWMYKYVTYVDVYG